MEIKPDFHFVGAIGRRYARTDEVAIPYGICVDFDSLKEPHTATLRERDSMLQVRMPTEDIPTTIIALSLDKIPPACSGGFRMTWHSRLV